MNSTNTPENPADLPADDAGTSTLDVRRLALVGGPVLALAVGAATSQLRDQVGATNVGVALALIVALTALTGRAAGLATAITAAFTFNFFHTQPYHSLRIHAARDVAIVALLAVLGLVVSDITTWRRRREAIAHRHDRAIEAPDTVGSMLAGVHPVGQVWPAVVNAVLDQLALADCGVVAQQPGNLALISRSTRRSADGDDTLVLPAKGASIAIVHDAKTIGYLVVMPPAGTTSLTIERRVIIAFADHLAIALTYGDRPFDASLLNSAVQ